jgi:FkbM family methyltransferase
MESNSNTQNFFFCIPLIPKANATDWSQVCNVLNQTLRSIANQTNKSSKILLAAHDKPDLAPDLKLDIAVIRPHWEAGSDIKGKWRDKRWKRTLLLRAVRKLGGGYVMMLDADDLVSNRLVDYVLKDRHPNGYIIDTGYAYDWKANLLAPIPGVWAANFDGVCGSCSVIYFRPEDLPPPRRKERSTYHLSKYLKQHSQWKQVMSDAGRPLKSLPFPGAVYVLNHDNNLHYLVSPSRQDTIPATIRSLRVPLHSDLMDEFALPVRTPLPASPGALPKRGMSRKSRLFSDCSQCLPKFSMTVAFDVGVHRGQTTLSILDHYPDAQIHAFDPAPATLAVFKALVGPRPNVTMIQVALSKARTSSRTEVEQASESSDLLSGDRYCEKQAIDHIAYLKIGNESSDLSVLQGFQRMIRDQRVDLIQVEAAMNPFNKRHVQFAMLSEFMKSHRYYLFGVYHQVRETRSRPLLHSGISVFISKRAVDANSGFRPKTESGLHSDSAGDL